MDFLVHFFRDILDGPLYWIVVAICFFLIIFILGFLVDRHEKKEKLRGLVESAPAGRDRMQVTDETTSSVQGITTNPVPVQNNTSSGTEDNQSVGILELSSDDYQDSVQVVDNNTNN